ncbi:MAG: NAD(P)H-hydrate dehydratase [Actinomycetia bacterium]|nr:NAD(P)H-hydrate dehydratase [Actinomycetes bacterium]
MQSIYSAAQVRAAESSASEPPEELMLRAAAAVAAAARDELGDRTQVLLAVGPGNNGGDALYAGAELASGRQVSAWRTAETVHPQAWQAFLDAGGREVGAGEALELLATADLVIDGVFGIGARAGLPGPVEDFADACAERGLPVLSVDLPSGLEADSAWAPTASFHPTRTLALGSYKACHLLGPASRRCGQVTLVDIGLPVREAQLQAWQVEDVVAAWPVPDESSDKYNRGVLGIDAGSELYPGAGILATLGAVYTGVGMVRFRGPEPVAEVLLRQLPNVVRAEGRVQAWLVGPGWGPRSDGAHELDELLGSGLPVVVDADALPYVPEHLGRADVLLTPHAGELAKLLGVPRRDVARDPVAAVRKAAGTYGVTVLLKGAVQYVAGPRSTTVHVAVPGPAWTAQAGSGDVLAGICGSLLAAGMTACQAAVCAASAQALTAAANPGPYPPQDLARRLPQTIAGFAR